MMQQIFITLFMKEIMYEDFMRDSYVYVQMIHSLQCILSLVFNVHRVIVLCTSCVQCTVGIILYREQAYKRTSIMVEGH